MDSGDGGIIIVGGTGIGSFAAHQATQTTTESNYCQTGDISIPSSVITISNTYNYERKLTEEEINYWHAIELKQYWTIPHKIGEPDKSPQKKLKHRNKSNLKRNKLRINTQKVL
jgi:hypothetical protein